MQPPPGPAVNPMPFNTFNSPSPGRDSPTPNLTRIFDSRDDDIVKDSNEGIPVKIKPLIDILNSQNISKIDALKIDIEGYEVSALKPFFNIAPVKLFPQKIVIEHTHKDGWGGEDFINTLKNKYDYVIFGHTRGNLLLRRG